MLRHILSLRQVLSQGGACTFGHQRGGDKSCRHCTFFHLAINICDLVCVICVCVCAFVRACVCVCVCVVRGGMRGWVLTSHQMGTTDAEIRALSSALLRNDVHLEDFMHLIILASQVTVTVRSDAQLA